MSYVVIRGCAESVDIVAMTRWFRDKNLLSGGQVVAVLKLLRRGQR